MVLLSLQEINRIFLNWLIPQLEQIGIKLHLNKMKFLQAIPIPSTPLTTWILMLVS